MYRGHRAAARKPVAVMESATAHTLVRMRSEEPGVDLCPSTTHEGDITNVIMDGFSIDTFADAESIEVGCTINIDHVRICRKQ